MKREIVVINKLVASEGMLITDGTNYGKVVRLAEGQTEDDFFEVPEEEYNRILEEKRKEQQL